MKSTAIPALVALALAGAAAAAPAPAPTPPPPPRIFLSPSGEPFRTGPSTPDPLRAWFDKADAKHQGYIDREEFRADAARFFKVLDENGDGVVDGFEAADYEHKIAPELAAEAEGRYPAQPDTGRSAGGGQTGQGQGGQGQGGEGQGGQGPNGPGGGSPGGGPGGHRGEGGFGHRGQGEDHTQGGDARQAARRPARRAIGQLINEPEPVTGADFNLDSHITLAEWMRATDQRFDLLDTDKTGRLTYAALKAKLDGPPTPARR
jgi:hypothetical protein